MTLLRKWIWRMVAVILAGALVILPIWDWSRYWLPAPIETRLFFPDDAWIFIPEEGSLAARIVSLREWKDARAVKKEERAANVLRWRSFEEFTFAGEFLSCENVKEGRWFIRFGEDGTLSTAVPGDKRFAGSRLKSESQIVDLGAIFQDTTHWRRLDRETIEFTNPLGNWKFSVTPQIEDVDGVLQGASPESCCNLISFASHEDPNLYFELCRDEANPSKFEFYRNRGKN